MEFVDIRPSKSFGGRKFESDFFILNEQKYDSSFWIKNLTNINLPSLIEVL